MICITDVRKNESLINPDKYKKYLHRLTQTRNTYTRNNYTDLKHMFDVPFCKLLIKNALFRLILVI